MAAAEEEFAFAASLCDHPLDTLIALHRSHDGGEIRETFRTLRPKDGPKPLRAFAFLDVEGEEEPAERVDRRVDLDRAIGVKRADQLPNEQDFWLSCGHHLLDRDEGGGLVVDRRIPQGLSGAAGARAAARSLRRRARAAREPAGRSAPAGRGRRDRRHRGCRRARELAGDAGLPRSICSRHRTIEAAYLDIVRRGIEGRRTLFINQLVHVILRNALDGCDDPYVLRAAELFFRPQRMTLHDGSLIAADEETIAGARAHAGVAAGLDARHSGRSRDRRDQRRQRRALFRAQRPVRRGARSDRRAGAACRRSADGDRALGRASARGRRRRSSR